MPQSTVDEILDRIDQLSPADQQLFEQRLAERRERSWQHEAASARRQALEQGIDQAAIDRAIQELRYPA